MKTLDRSKPFGTVHGDDAPHRFEQDGLAFDAQGHQVGGKHTASSSSAESEVEQQVASQVAAQTEVSPHGAKAKKK